MDAKDFLGAKVSSSEADFSGDFSGADSNQAAGFSDFFSGTKATSTDPSAPQILANDYPPASDSLQRLWTPHRMVYIHTDDESKDDKQCPFCTAPKKSDEDGLIVARGKYCFAILNLFPYNSGHAMICPNEHISSYIDLSGEALLEFTHFTQTLIKAMKNTLRPDGFNLGMNQGEVSGAGVAAHLHQHIVPRWAGDSNFFPIIAETKAMPAILTDTRKQLADEFANLV
jgi:ATP adenylyltransferase